MSKKRVKVAPHLWNRQEYLLQGRVYEHPDGRFDIGPPVIGPTFVRQATEVDLDRYERSRR